MLGNNILPYRQVSENFFSGFRTMRNHELVSRFKKVNLLTIAREISQFSRMPYKHGAVLVLRSEEMFTGYNHNNFLAVRALRGISPEYRNVHAEADVLMHCIRFNQKLTKNGIMFVYGETKTGRRTFSKPCKLCRNLMRLMRIRYVGYSTPTSNCEILDLRKEK